MAKGKQSAGLLMFRRLDGRLEVLLAHPGGPLWARKDLGAWTIPKGEYTDAEEPLAAAQREFQEETGFTPSPPFIALASIKQKSGKVVSAWAFEGDCDPTQLSSNTFEMEWPKHSGRMQTFPEVERAEWFAVEEARKRILPAQEPLLDRLSEWAETTSGTEEGAR